MPPRTGFSFLGACRGTTVEKTRVRLFIDFWNFQLNWNEFHSRTGATAVVQIPWKELPSILTAEVSKGQPVRFTGAHVYASVDQSNPKDAKLNNWFHHVLASYTGYVVEVRPRKPRRAIRCREESCRTLIATCPACKAALKGTVEKGVDAAVITDLLTLAFDDNYDISVLISGDADYAPAVQYILWLRKRMRLNRHIPRTCHGPSPRERLNGTHADLAHYPHAHYRTNSPRIPRATVELAADIQWPRLVDVIATRINRNPKRASSS